MAHAGSFNPHHRRAALAAQRMVFDHGVSTPHSNGPLLRKLQRVCTRQQAARYELACQQHAEAQVERSQRAALDALAARPLTAEEREQDSGPAPRPPARLVRVTSAEVPAMVLVHAKTHLRAAPEAVYRLTVTETGDVLAFLVWASGRAYIEPPPLGEGTVHSGETSMAFYFDSSRTTSPLYDTLDEAKTAAEQHLALGLGHEVTVSRDGGDSEPDVVLCRRTLATRWAPVLVLVAAQAPGAPPPGW